ncbi:MAG: ATP-binding protein [Polyangiaceae bacterium]|nr:ATP-binding protein [Polyangiaceae bacterium]
MPERDVSPYARLRRQMLVVLVLFGLLPLSIASVAGLLANRAELDARSRNVLEAMVKNRKVTVELFLEEKLRQLELAAAMLPVAELSRRAALEGLFNELARERGGIVDLGFIGNDGRHIAYIGPYHLEQHDYHKEQWFTQVMVRGRYESDVFLGFRRFPHMVMAVRKHEGGKAFVLRATIDTDLLSTLVREGGLETGADVYILNRAGEYQTRYSDAHRLMEKAALTPIPTHSGVRVVEVSGARNEYVATAWLRTDAWVLVAVQPMPGLGALLSTHPSVTLVLVLGWVLLPLLSVLVARHRLRQIRELEGERAALYESVAQTQKMAAIGRLAASVAHEINNPLAVIHAQAGALEDALVDGPDFPLAGELRDRLCKIAAQIDRGRKVTHRLLGFSRRVGPDVEPVDVAVALDEAVSFVEKEAEASRIRIVREYAKDAPIVHSSVSQMQQVFLNLVNNAMDAIGRDGEVRLRVASEGEGVRVHIDDNGPGIPAQDLERVFEPFFSTKRGSSGHGGLGLAICKETMRNLGGRIDVRSEVGKGTEYTLWFPRQAPE